MEVYNRTWDYVLKINTLGAQMYMGTYNYCTESTCSSFLIPTSRTNCTNLQIKRCQI